jgi:hypothetical protein
MKANLTLHAVCGAFMALAYIPLRGEVFDHHNHLLNLCGIDPPWWEFPWTTQPKSLC